MQKASETVANNATIQKPLGVIEAAQFTGYSVPYIYKMVHLKKIPYYKPAQGRKGRVFFKLTELEEFCLRGKHNADYEIAEAAERILNKRGRVSA